MLFVPALELPSSSWYMLLSSLSGRAWEGEHSLAPVQGKGLEWGGNYCHSLGKSRQEQREAEHAEHKPLSVHGS